LERGAGGRVAVTVAAISRASITPIVDAIEAFKPETIVISTEPEASADRIVVLTRQANREGRLRRARARLVGALALAGFAAAICMGLWIFVGNSLSTARDEVAREIADRRAILAGRQDVGDSAATALARTKRTAAASVIILEELSRALPDDTYLTRMKIHDGKVEIAGVTREAAALIKILEQTEAFQRATFSAPTTQTPGDDNEQFQIEADIKPTLAVTP
jgi:general secretion pathway protein L